MPPSNKNCIWSAKNLIALSAVVLIQVNIISVRTNELTLGLLIPPTITDLILPYVITQPWLRNFLTSSPSPSKCVHTEENVNLGKVFKIF